MDQYQEVLELRNVAVRLVSHLAQLPSSAVHFKDVLLSLPTTHRQQLQVRESIQSDDSNLYIEQKLKIRIKSVNISCGVKHFAFKI